MVEGNAQNAMDRALLGFAQNVMEVVSAIHATAVENVRYVMVRVIANIAVESLGVVPVAATAIVSHARTAMANAPLVMGGAIIGSTSCFPINPLNSLIWERAKISQSLSIRRGRQRVAVAG